MCKWKARREKGHKLIKAFCSFIRFQKHATLLENTSRILPVFTLWWGLRGFCASNYNIECQPDNHINIIQDAQATELSQKVSFFKSSVEAKNKVSLQTRLERLYKLSIYLFFCVNFENLTVKFYVPYVSQVLNMQIKFRSNWILFTILSINLFFIHNFRL